MTRNMKSATKTAGASDESRRLSGWSCLLPIAAFLLLLACCRPLCAQTEAGKQVPAETTEEKLKRLTTAIEQAQAALLANQKLMLDLQQELNALQKQVASENASHRVTNGVPSPASTEAVAPTSNPVSADQPVGASATVSTPANASLDEVRERQTIDESQIATHELTKVETQSKYPLTLSGLVLFNAFVNTRQVDVAASPAYALPGSGSTGLSLRQTVLGLDARGPHLWGATSHADLRLDFFASGVKSNYTTGGILRLRTAHATLNWKDTEAFVELDRSILQPESPSSLLALGQPELAWSGNLWAWNPQVGVSHQFSVGNTTKIETTAALIDVQDPQLPNSGSSTPPVTRSELSRWPGTEGRIALLSRAKDTGFVFGVGGYFSPHRTADKQTFDSWAGTADMRLPLTRHFELTANAYRGQGLGGLGGGGYVDYLYGYVGSKEVANALDDVGGWAQFKARAGQRWEWNTGYGIDNPFAKEINLSIAAPDSGTYAGLARNRSYFGNVIYSPSKYLLFSLEYRRLWSSFAGGSTNPGDVIGIGAGYKF
jgi:hypothetical protein